jgi:hypothetical protein
MGISGPRPSRFDLQFVEWCEARRMPCVRTVDLFWAFEYHRKGFPRKVSAPRLRARWNDERARRRLVAAGLLTNNGNDRRILVLPKTTPRQVALERLSPEDREYLDDETPDPGTWQQYSRERIAYFEVERHRYEQVLHFWRSIGPEHRQTFIACAGYSNRRPEAHPDYLVACPRIVQLAFVEVKGPKDYLRPTQRRFFPELASQGGQEVWLARCTADGSGIAFRRFEGATLIPHDTLFGKAIGCVRNGSGVP